MADKVNQPAAPLGMSMDKQSSPPLPAPPSTDKKQPPLEAVTVSMEVTSSTTSTVTKVSSVDKIKPPSLSPILLPCLYALCNAFIFAVDAIVTLIINRTPCTPNQSTWFWKCVELTDAADAEVRALVRGQLWCSVLLMGRRRRWAWGLAFAALAATVATHYMSARVDRIFLAAVPGDDAGNAVDVVVDFVVAALDVGFMSLLFFGVGEEE